MSYQFLDPTEELLAVHGADVGRSCIEIAAQTGGKNDSHHLLGLLDDEVLRGWIVLNEDDEYRGFICGQVSRYETGKVYTFNGAAGITEKRVEELDLFFVSVATHYDCVAYEIKGRRGFLKLFAKFGMKEDYVSMSREL